MSGPIEFRIPGHVPSAANLREHWRARHGRTKQQRLHARTETWYHVPLTTVKAVRDFGGVVTLTRVAPRPLDSDNLASSLKAHRDGIADALGVNDGDARIQWVYAQAKCGKGEQGVLVKIGGGNP